VGRREDSVEVREKREEGVEIVFTARIAEGERRGRTEL